MKKLTLPLALVVAAAFSASPALAQKGHGNGHGNGKHSQNTEVRGQRAHRDDDDDRYDDRRYRNDGRYDTYQNRNNTRLQRRVPPGWCIGRGNPHNTVANCGAGNNRYDRRYDPRYNGYGNYDPRYGGNAGNMASYSDWKRWHDQQCRDLSRQRPLDLRWQYEVRTQCAAEDRAARQRYGV